MSGHSQDLVLQEKNDMFGYVDQSGKTIIPFEYTFAFTDTFTSLAFVVHDSKIKAIDRNNNKLFTVYNYDNGPDPESEGLFRIVKDGTGEIGYANMQGKVVIPTRYFFSTPFTDGLAAFNAGGKKETINSTDNYSEIKGGKWGLIDREGKEIFPAIFDSVSFEDGSIYVKIGDSHFNLKRK